MEDKFEVRDYRNKQMFRVDDEYLNGYSKLCGVNATMVYLCLCRHADRHQESFPSVALMAEKTGISKRSVIRGIQTLIEWNIISKERERKENAQWLNNRYILLDKSIWKSKPSATQTLGSQVPNKTEPSANDDQSQVPQVHTKVTHIKDTHIRSSEQSSRDKPKHNPLGAELLKAFEEVDSKNKTYYGNTTQRKACDFLLQEYGLEEVLKRITVLPQTNKIPYFPAINTPHDLKEKWVKLQDAVDKKRNEAKTLQDKKGICL